MSSGWIGATSSARSGRDKPDIVGVTITTENRFQSFKLVRLAKKAHPGALTVLGGPHASMAAEDCLAHIPELDVVVRGEGEIHHARHLPGLGGGRPTLGAPARRPRSRPPRSDGRPRLPTPPGRPIADLDALPFPAFHLVPFEKYNFQLPRARARATSRRSTS